MTVIETVPFTATRTPTLVPFTTIVTVAPSSNAQAGVKTIVNVWPTLTLPTNCVPLRIWHGPGG